MIRRAPLLLAAALLAPACAEPVQIGVKWKVAEACRATELSAIHLNCNATVGIWLRSGESTRDYLRRMCVDFPGSDGESLDQLKPLLADVVLSTTSSEAIWVEVKIWGPWSLAEDGCVDPGELGESPALPEIIVWGQSEPIDLSDSTREIEILLDCVTVDRPGIPDACDEVCMGSEESCFAGVWAESCLDDYEECVEPCETDATCVAECEGKYNGCLAESPDGTCQLRFLGCSSGCKEGDACWEACVKEQDSCIQDGCSGVHEKCVEESCDPSTMCHAVVDG